MATISQRNGKFLARVRITGLPSASAAFDDKRAAQAWAAHTEDAIRLAAASLDQVSLTTLVHLRDSWSNQVTASTIARSVPLTLKVQAPLKEAIGERKHGQLFSEKPGSISQAWRPAVTRARRAYEGERIENDQLPDPTYLQNLRLHDARHDAITLTCNRLNTWGR